MTKAAKPIRVRTLQARLGIGSTEDWIKLAAGIGALSVLLGVTFNVSFFVSEPEWLFLFSVADNLAATLYALPLVVVILVAQACAMSIVWAYLNWSTTAPRLEWAKRLIVALAVIFFLGVVAAIALQQPNLLLWPLIPEILVLSVATAAFVDLHLLLEDRVLITLLGTALTAVIITIGAGWSARANLGLGVEIELAGKPSSSDKGTMLRGSLVRFLDGGVILELSDGRWLWLPKTEIQRVTRDAPEKSRALRP